MNAKRTMRRSAGKKAGAPRGRTDWKRLAKMTDAAVKAAAAEDIDTFIPDKEWWRRARVVVPTPKRLISLRLDADVVAWFRRQGRGYQTRMNAVLRSYVAAHADDRGGKRAAGD